MIIAEKYEYTFPHLTEEEMKNAEMCLNHIFRVHFDGNTLPYEVRQILRKMALDEIAANTQCGRLNEDCIKDTVYHMDMFSTNGNLTQIKVVAELILDMNQIKNKRCTNYDYLDHDIQTLNKAFNTESTTMLQKALADVIDDCRNGIGTEKETLRLITSICLPLPRRTLWVSFGRRKPPLRKSVRLRFWQLISLQMNCMLLSWFILMACPFCM